MQQQVQDEKIRQQNRLLERLRDISYELSEHTLTLNSQKEQFQTLINLVSISVIPAPGGRQAD
jgi:hypothetical protein